MYNTEKEFSKALMHKLKSEGYHCSRIETATTITGIPDLFIMGNGDDFFIELKNNKQVTLNKGIYKVPWRAGQQAWALQYQLAHKTGCITKHTWTIMSVKDGIIFIRMDKYREDNIANLADDSVFIFTDKEFREMCLMHFLTSNTYIIDTKLCTQGALVN